MASGEFEVGFRVSETGELHLSRELLVVPPASRTAGTVAWPLAVLRSRRCVTNRYLGRMPSCRLAMGDVSSIAFRMQTGGDVSKTTATIQYKVRRLLQRSWRSRAVTDESTVSE